MGADHMAPSETKEWPPLFELGQGTVLMCEWNLATSLCLPTTRESKS